MDNIKRVLMLLSVFVFFLINIFINFENHVNAESNNITIKITKVDDASLFPISKSDYGLFEDPSAKKQIGPNRTTNGFGVLEFSNLSPGKYYLKELKAAKEFPQNDKVYKIVINANNTLEIENIDNKVTVGEMITDNNAKIFPIQIKSVRNIGYVFSSQSIDGVKASDLNVLQNKMNTDYFLKDVEFGISAKPNTNTSDPDFSDVNFNRTYLNGKYTTNEKTGKKEIRWTSIEKDVPDFKLNPGIYTVRVINQQNGYGLEKEFDIEIGISGSMHIVNDSNIHYARVTLDHLNRYSFAILNSKVINLRVNKVLKSNPNFKINFVGLKLLKKHPIEEKPGTVFGSYSTSNHGSFEIENLSPGEYFLKEYFIPEILNKFTNREYSINEYYYKIIISNLGEVTLGDKMYYEKNGKYISLPTNDDVQYDGLVNGTKQITFKNEYVYRFSIENDLFSSTKLPRIWGNKFTIRPQDSNTRPPEFFKPSNSFNVYWNELVPQNGQINGIPVDKNSISWEYTTGHLVNPDYWNPILRLSEGTYILEQLGDFKDFEKLDPIEINISKEGTLTVKGYKRDKTLMDSGDILWISNAVSKNHNFKKLNVFSKKPMKIYLDKFNQHNRRINIGKLKIKLKGANIFEFEGNMIDEKTFNLETDYVSGKGLEITIPKTLPDGKYILTEVNAPDGFKKSEMRYHIIVNQYSRTVTLEKTDTGEGTASTNVNRVIFNESVIENPEYTTAENTRNIEITNNVKEFPPTGGLGTIFYVISGFTLMAGAIYLYTKREIN